jgi:hypothetical protein
MAPIVTLRRELREWLVSHRLDRDTAFLDSDQWHARNEPYLRDASLILIFEGALFSVVNGRREDSVELYDQLTRLAERLGYFFEFGDAWNIGFYPAPSVFSKYHQSSSKAQVERPREGQL